MRFRRRPSDVERLNRYWNELATGHNAGPASESAQLDPAIVQTIGRLTAADDARSPDPAFYARLEQTLMETAQTMQPVWQPLPAAVAPNLNGHQMPAPWTRSPEAGNRRTRSFWTYASLAAALLLILAGIGAYFAAGTHFFGDGNQHHNVIPAATQNASPIPDVPMYRNTPGRTGVMPGPGPIGAPVPFWTVSIGGGLTSAIAVSDGIIYGMGDDGVLHALDAVTGQEHWSVDIGSGSADVTAQFGLVYAGPDDGTLSAYDAATGVEQWRYVVGARSGVTAPVDGVVYGAGANGVAFALDGASGNERWRVQLSQSNLRGPVVGDGALFYGSDDGNLLAVDAASGELLRRYDSGLEIVVTPVFADGLVFSSPRIEDTGPSAIVAVDAETGDEVWRYEPEGASNCLPPAIASGVAYANCDNGLTYALDASTGEIIWQSGLGTHTVVSAAIAIADDTVYESIDERVIRAIDITDGAELWRYEADGRLGQFAITGGVIYFGSTLGTITALGGVDDPNAPADLATPIPAPILVAASPSPVASEPVAFVGTVAASDPALSFLLAIDANGNRYFADRVDGRLAKVAPDGTILAMIGDASGPGVLGEPFSVVVDDDGNIFVGDNERDVVKKFDANGAFLLEFGSTGHGEGQFDGGAVPDGIDAQGRLYVDDWGNHRIQVFDLDGNFLFMFGGFGAAEGKLAHPNALALDADGNVYVAECDNRRLSKFGPDGEFIAAWDHDFNCLAGVAVDKEHGLVYVGDADNSRIQVFDTNGNFVAMWGSPEATDGPLFAPLFPNLDGQGNVFVTDIATAQTSQFQLRPPLWPEDGAPTA